MSTYLSHSKFFKWLRKKVFKINKPNALGMKEWDDWYADIKSNQPIGYFFTETFPGLLDKHKKITGIPRSIRYWYANRFRNPTHALTSNLKRGQYHEVDTRILHCMFDQLVYFCEHEKAWSYAMWNSQLPKYFPNSWNRFFIRPEKSINAYLESVKWETQLVNEIDEGGDGLLSQQAKNAQEVYDLYVWWKFDRPEREADQSIHSIYEELRKKYPHTTFLSGLSEEDQKKLVNWGKAVREKELKDWNEDTEMLIRLIKIRGSLWT